MRTSLLVIALAACKTDPAPAPAATVASSDPLPRRAKLPALTRTNALVVGVQLRAESAWNDATAMNTADAWDLAADLFARSRDACPRECSDLAYAAVLARKNAIAADASLVRPVEKPTSPEEMPERVVAFIDAADAYAASAPAGDSEAAGISFLAGKQFNDYGYVDESTTRFADIVRANPTHDVALYSANLLLDAFNRSERYEDLVAWARTLQGNAVLMASHAELAEVVAQILARAAGAN